MTITELLEKVLIDYFDNNKRLSASIEFLIIEQSIFDRLSTELEHNQPNQTIKWLGFKIISSTQIPAGKLIIVTATKSYSYESIFSAN